MNVRAKPATVATEFSPKLSYVATAAEFASGIKLNSLYRKVTINTADNVRAGGTISVDERLPGATVKVDGKTIVENGALTL